MNTDNDLEKKVKNVLRRLDQAVQRDGSPEESHPILSRLFGEKTLGILFSEILFAVGMGFVGLFTAMIAIILNDSADKLMFGCFALVCCLICAYKIDKTSRQFRRMASCGP